MIDTFAHNNAIVPFMITQPTTNEETLKLKVVKKVAVLRGSGSGWLTSGCLT